MMEYIVMCQFKIEESSFICLFSRSPLALTWSILLTIVWLYFLETPDPHLIPHYTLGVIMFAVSSCIEVLAEPLFVTGQAFMFIRLKVNSTYMYYLLYLLFILSIVLFLF